MKRLKYISAMLFAGLTFMSCEEVWYHCVEGNGDRITETRDLNAFSQIQVNGDFEVQLDTGDASTAKIEADENLMDLIVTHVSGDKLYIEARDGDCLKPSHPIEITITTAAVSNIDLNGSGYVYCYGLETEALEVRLSGSGQIDCYELIASAVTYELEGSGLINSNLTAETLVSQVEGSGEIRLSGTAVSEDLKIIGSGRIKADQVNADACVVYISGSGIADAWVNNALDVTIIGSGIVYYQGNPTVESYISGSGKVIRH